ncbi:efflux transporter outer membrane subunit [Sphingomonas koreensis]
MIRPLLCLPLLLVAPACTVGPNFRQPLPPTSERYVPGPLPARIPAAPGAPAQRLRIGMPIAERWWTQFGNAQLDSLIDEALATNADLAAADAALRQARALAGVAAGAQFPALDLGYQSERTQTSRSLSGVLADSNRYLYSLNTAQVSVSYPLDLFGGLRRKTESARAAAEAQMYRAEAARLTLATNTVLTVIRIAALEEQIVAARTSIRANRTLLTLFRRRQDLGQVGAADVAAQETVVAQAEGALPPLIKAATHQRAILNVLLGREPGAAPPSTIPLDRLALPTDLPLALPSTLVRQRPDIRAAEAQLHGASADVGVAIAARLPSITLSANYGGKAIEFQRMFAGGNPFWSIVGGIAQPLFRGGALKRQQQAAEAGLDGAKAQYRSVVLTALVDVSDALTALHQDAAALTSAAQASEAADRNLHFVTRQLALGDVDTLVVLNATNANAAAQAQLAQARAARFADTAALYQALGGGWSVNQAAH